jgi:hypothetical protein
MAGELFDVRGRERVSRQLIQLRSNAPSHIDRRFSKSFQCGRGKSKRVHVHFLTKSLNAVNTESGENHGRP